MTRDEALSILLRGGRVDAPATLFDLWTCTDEIAAADAPYLACYAWSVAEYPSDALNLDAWGSLFGGVPYGEDGRRTLTRDGEPIPVPDRRVRLYRGAPADKRAGMSWTTSPAVAASFAGDGMRGRPAGVVWTVEAAPWRLLANIVDMRPGEDEWVLDPAGLVVEEVAR